MDIIGYFSLSLNTLDIVTSISNTLRKKLTGFNKPVDRHKHYACPYFKELEVIPIYLLGQIARDEKYDNSVLPGPIMLKYIFAIILYTKKLLGGRVLLAECADAPELRTFYEENRFTLLQQRQDSKLLQYIKDIQSD